jgi:DNA-binding transcriptional LysR family regulator
MANPLDLRRLRHLAAVLREGSISSAAARLGLSQPALSASIKTLEADLDVQLLRRHNLGIEATPTAELLVSHGRRIDQQLDVALDAVATLNSRDASGFSIGCGPSEASRLLPLALNRWRSVVPGVRLFVEYGLNEALMPMVRRGEVAFALSSIPRSAAHPELQHEPLHVDTAVIVARVGHPLAKRRSLSAKDLAAYPWVLARRWELERKALDELFAQSGLEPIQAQVETTSAVLMKSLLLHSDFLTFVPHEMVFWEEGANLLRPLKGVGSMWQRHVGITTRRDAVLPPQAQRLVQLLRETAQKFSRR